MGGNFQGGGLGQRTRQVSENIESATVFQFRYTILSLPAADFYKMQKVSVLYHSKRRVEKGRTHYTQPRYLRQRKLQAHLQLVSKKSGP